MNERTHFVIKIYLSHFILERVDVDCVWEVSWRQGQTVTYWPKVLLTIAALLPDLGWGCSTVSYWGLQALSLQVDSHAGILSPTDSNSNWNWPKPSVFLRLFTQVHLLIDGSVKGQYVTRGLSWNYWWLRDTNHVKFTGEWVMFLEKHTLVKKNIFTNGLNMGLLLQAWMEKTVNGVETSTLL